MNFFAILAAMITKSGNLPSLCGVYLFKQDNQILYIGKSVNIKARVASHIENAKLDPKEKLIVTQANKLDYIACDSEFNALLLESQLIQKFHPKYNARLQDDKSFLYIKITIKNEFPKIFAVRRENDGKSLYFGPFSSHRNVETILKEVRRIFPYCGQKVISKRACFYSKIGLCRPCPSVVAHIQSDSLKAQLKREYRQNIRHIVEVLEGKTKPVIGSLQKQLTTLSKQKKFEEALIIRNKLYRFEHLLYNTSFPLDKPDFYNRSQERLISLYSLLSAYFIHFPHRIARIECYDMSNTGGREATASMVVFTDGAADKSQYRRFKIKNLTLKSDFEMLEETLIRRFSKAGWPLPDLVVIDGGRPQLKVVRKVWYKKGLVIPFVGIAKNPDRIIIGPTLQLLKIPQTHNGFNLLKALRDESHRFAHKYHRFLRDKKLHS